MFRKWDESLSAMGPKLDDFEVLSTIGSGAHGTVRKVCRRKDKQVLVWKELNYGSMSESEKQGLVTEVNLLRELRHPNVVKFLHHVVERRTTTLYILMEYCPGGDLKCLISKCRHTSTFLEEGFIWRVLKQLCDAMKVCHSRELCGGRVILHRDIKPANVFLDANGDVKLGDFGLARTLNSEASFATTFVGTPYYMSPEVINGQEYNEASDMWSLGCLIYELCALQPPFQATTHKQLAAKIREAKYERIPIQYSSDLQEILGLLLTYEDFLRPTALMILHHSSLVARTSTKCTDNEDDPLYHSLSPTVLLNSGNTEKKSGSTENTNELTVAQESYEIQGKCEAVKKRVSDDVGCDYEDEQQNKPNVNCIPADSESPLCATYSVLNRDTESDKESLVNNVKKLYINSPITRSSENINKEKASLDDTIEKMCRDAKEARKPSPAVNKYQDIITEVDLVTLNCACGGMSMNNWRERVLALREAEVSVRDREVNVKERERDVIHREHRVAAMEREARQHLVRAQIYLKQARHRQNVATSPHRPSSDLDTTMSADIGDDTVHTTAKLDPQRLENPFLKMRGLQQQPEKRVSFDEKPVKFKSNTLDNPKSRRKRGNIFGLADRTTENRNVREQRSDESESRVPLKPVGVNKVISREQCPKAKPKTLISPSPRMPAEDAESALVSRMPKDFLIKSNSSENINKKSAEMYKDKENAPIKGVTAKRIPEVKQSLRTGKTGSYTFERPSRRNTNGRKGQNKVPVLQFYNVV